MRVKMFGNAIFKFLKNDMVNDFFYNFTINFDCKINDLKAARKVTTASFLHCRRLKKFS